MPFIIPKKLAQNDDLIVISRKEYEQFLELKENTEFKLTLAQEHVLKQARKNLAMGKFLTIEQLKQKLGIEN